MRASARFRNCFGVKLKRMSALTQMKDSGWINNFTFHVLKKKKIKVLEPRGKKKCKKIQTTSCGDKSEIP